MTICEVGLYVRALPLQETLENVKKCKNFLVTLIKLASSGTQSPDMAANVKALVRALLVSSGFVYVLSLVGKRDNQT